jgi:hypothetical protein
MSDWLWPVVFTVLAFVLTPPALDWLGVAGFWIVGLGSGAGVVWFLQGLEEPEPEDRVDIEYIWSIDGVHQGVA